MSSRSGYPPALVLGGSSNALSIARSLHALGVEVYGLGLTPFVERSRFLTAVGLPAAENVEAALAEALLGRATDHLRGGVLLAGGDGGLSVITAHPDALAERFVLDVADVGARRKLLDKLTTYELAREAGVPTPRFWRVDGLQDLERCRDELVFPLILKPLSSHRYQERFPGGSKFRRAKDIDELRIQLGEMIEAGIPVMLVEQIVEPDDRLCSYYTYLDESGNPTFHLTKRVIRRYPSGMGLGTHHVTDWDPAVRDLSLQMFKHVGLRGPAIAEFIRDSSDGQLKLIECTPRFTAATALVVAAGLDLPRHVYLRALGHEHELPSSYTVGLRMLYPAEDFRSFLELRATGDLTMGGWLRSVAHRQVFPFARWDDPAPAVARTALRLPKLLSSLRGAMR